MLLISFAFTFCSCLHDASHTLHSLVPMLNPLFHHNKELGPRTRQNLYRRIKLEFNYFMHVLYIHNYCDYMYKV